MPVAHQPVSEVSKQSLLSPGPGRHSVPVWKLEDSFHPNLYSWWRYSYSEKCVIHRNIVHKWEQKALCTGGKALTKYKVAAELTLSSCCSPICHSFATLTALSDRPYPNIARAQNISWTQTPWYSRIQILSPHSFLSNSFVLKTGPVKCAVVTVFNKTHNSPSWQWLYLLVINRVFFYFLLRLQQLVLKWTQRQKA